MEDKPVALPTHVYLFTNGTVAGFDGRGEQMPAWQGRISEVLPRLLQADHNSKVQFVWSEFSRWLQPVSYRQVEAFARMLEEP